MLKKYQQQFIETAIRCEALSFGEFELKSGRISPYFFNAGRFDDAQALSEIGRCYADAIIDAKLESSDILFGPAYKGIPLATCTASALYEHHQCNIQCSFNRKEKKQHGEGGQLIGAPVKGDVLIIDDVITAGTAVREVFELLSDHDATIKALMIGVNRQEVGPNGVSAIQELEDNYGIKVHSIISASDLMVYLSDTGQEKHLDAMKNYLQQYGS